MKRKIVRLTILSGIFLIAFLCGICVGKKANAKVKQCMVYAISGNTITYCDTKEYKPSGNAMAVGKKRKIRLNDGAEFYWFCFKGEGLSYKKVSREKFIKKAGKQIVLNGNLACSLKIKNKKVVKIIVEYQA